MHRRGTAVTRPGHPKPFCWPGLFPHCFPATKFSDAAQMRGRAGQCPPRAYQGQRGCPHNTGTARGTLHAHDLDVCSVPPVCQARLSVCVLAASFQNNPRKESLLVPHWAAGQTGPGKLPERELARENTAEHHESLALWLWSPALSVSQVLAVDISGRPFPQAESLGLRAPSHLLYRI